MHSMVIHFVYCLGLLSRFSSWHLCFWPKTLRGIFDLCLWSCLARVTDPAGGQIITPACLQFTQTCLIIIVSKPKTQHNTKDKGAI